MDFQGIKYLVVGAGFTGSVIAERIANDLKERVLVIEKRKHLGGNCYSETDSETGIECHVYGSHIFHTGNREVWNYINRFSEFNHYRHKVLTTRQGKVYQMPINLQTINAHYDKSLAPTEAEMFLRSEIARAGISNPVNLEEKAVSLIGRSLYEAFIKGYTVKQWGTDPKDLPAEIITRLPVRFNYKSDYFDDPWQGIPLHGYTGIFDRMLTHPNISLMPDTDFFAMRNHIPADCMIVYTGPIDRFCEYKFGRLGWRDIVLEKEICLVGDYQGTAVMNYADVAIPTTRIHEFRHYHEERLYPADKSVIFREYSKDSAGDDPYYPINTAKDRAMFEQYRNEVASMPNVILGGRLGSYSYLDMDQAIAGALAIYEKKIKVNNGQAK
jgi:UDP-galactopyranose mutase